MTNCVYFSLTSALTIARNVGGKNDSRHKFSKMGREPFSKLKKGKN